MQSPPELSRTLSEPLPVGHTLFGQPDMLAAYIDWRIRLLQEPLRGSGHTQIFGWDLAYVSGPAVVGGIEYLVLYGVNDFYPRHEHPVILDCGANIGISVLNYKRQFPRAHIVAFEPDPEFAPVLRRNLKKTVRRMLRWWKRLCGRRMGRPVGIARALMAANWSPLPRRLL